MSSSEVLEKNQIQAEKLARFLDRKDKKRESKYLTVNEIAAKKQNKIESIKKGAKFLEKDENDERKAALERYENYLKEKCRVFFPEIEEKLSVNLEKLAERLKETETVTGFFKATNTVVSQDVADQSEVIDEGDEKNVEKDENVDEAEKNEKPKDTVFQPSITRKFIKPVIKSGADVKDDKSKVKTVVTKKANKSVVLKNISEQDFPTL